MEVPESPENVCPILAECCSRYSEISSILEISCRTDYEDECCAEDNADSTCCDLMSPPDCTETGCGLHEVCDEVTKLCITGEAQPDCMGVIGGNSVEDECGICGGDGSTCDECTRRTFADSVAYCEAIGKKIATFSSQTEWDSVGKLQCNKYIGATSDGDGNWS
eukprot:TRINITY_DN3916_c0_g1_i1.p1 TRINITY_DN3916_c0_g1~~TRINITY_DN3916_c0_g1_i1.p1  ORF type:complete len:186 (+),score=35.76 TRINITY_DN3916_c0_g1_i1:68-559(+)